MNNKKRILIFIDWYLPGYKAGGPIQSVANLVAHLKADHEISIITRDTDYSESRPYTTIKSDTWLERDGTRICYISKSQLKYSTIHKLISEESFDYVYLNGIYSLYFTLIPLFILRKGRGYKIVVAARGMLSKGSLNVKKTKKNLFLRMIKMARLFSGVTFHATTEMEHREIQVALGDKMMIKTAGNLPPLQEAVSFHNRKKEAGEVKLINIARIAPEKNLLLSLQILQQIKKPVLFDVYGPVYNHSYWEQCKKVIQNLPEHVKVNYKGSLESHKVMQVLKEAHFLFMPTSGENFGHIILQSLTAGTPVIISDQTPWKDLKNKHCGWDVALNQTERFIEILETCSEMTQSDYDNYSQNAHSFAFQYIHNPQLIQQNIELFS